MAVAKLIINSIPGDQFYLLATVCYCPFIPAQTQILYLFSATSFCFLVPLVLGESFCHCVIMSGVVISCHVMSHCHAVRRPRDLGGAARVHEDGVQVRVARVTCHASRVLCHTLSRVTRTVRRTVRGEYRRGKPHCAWTSCREGCTHEVYTCWQIEVSTAQYCTVQYPIYKYPPGGVQYLRPEPERGGHRARQTLPQREGVRLPAHSRLRR